jgi:putative acetyltransferase
MIAAVGKKDHPILIAVWESAGRGRGIGRKLLHYALNKLLIKRVTVNEQNIEALNFYCHFGFRKVSKDKYDGEGKKYPLLHLVCRE